MGALKQLHLEKLARMEEIREELSQIKTGIIAGVFVTNNKLRVALLRARRLRKKYDEIERQLEDETEEAPAE